MKKTYLQPVFKIVYADFPFYIMATSTKGDAAEVHYGEDNPTKDKEETPTIGGTGDDEGFILGSKGSISYWND